MDREKLLAHLQGDAEKQIGISVIDAAELAWKTNRAQITDFFDPYEQKVAKSVLSALVEFNVLTYNGYRQAERARLGIAPHFFLTEAIEVPVKVLDVRGNFKFVQVSHRDYLGSLMGLGIKREKVGDILCLDDGCQVVVASEIAEFIILNWNQVHRVPVTVTAIDPEQVEIAPERVKEIKTTVASMRLDAVAASGYGMSRTKMAQEIRNEKIKVNWQMIANPAREVAEGDVLSFRGRGRVIVEEITGKTKKGRFGLILQRLM